MKIRINLETRRGAPYKEIEAYIASISCNSDAAQQMPHKVLHHEGRVYGYVRDTYNCLGGLRFTFRERDELCV